MYVTIATYTLIYRTNENKFTGRYIVEDNYKYVTQCMYIEAKAGLNLVCS